MTLTEQRRFMFTTLDIAGAVLGLSLVLGAHATFADERCMKELSLVSQTKARDLHNGYTIYYESYEAPSSNHMEGRVHYECLRYNGTAVGPVGVVSVSPTQHLILFSDTIAGTWVLADDGGNRVTVGTIGSSFEHFDAIIWDETAAQVRVTYTDGSNPSTFEFSTLAKQPSQATQGAAPHPQPAPAGSRPRG